MITGNLAHLERLAGQLTGPIKKALELLAERDVTELPAGKIPLAGEDIFASVNVYETEPAADRRPEKHFQYIDIQVLGAGREKIGYTDMENAGEITEDRRETNDVVFYDKVEKENFVQLEKGILPFSFLGKSIGPTVNLRGRRKK